MDSILSFLKGQTWFDTLVTKLIRHGATYLGGAIMALALNHGVDHNTATDLQNEIIGLVVTLGGLAYSYWDGKIVDKKIAVAAATGADSPQAAVIAAQVDQAAADSAAVTKTIAKVQDAISQADTTTPKTMGDEIDNLKAGKG